MSNASEKEIKLKKRCMLEYYFYCSFASFLQLKKNKFLSHILCKSSLSKSDILYVKWKNRSAFRKI